MYIYDICILYTLQMRNNRYRKKARLDVKFVEGPEDECEVDEQHAHLLGRGLRSFTTVVCMFVLCCLMGAFRMLMCVGVGAGVVVVDVVSRVIYLYY